MLDGIFMVTLTEKAAKQLEELIAEDKKTNNRENSLYALRVAVRGGGCSGFQYELSFDYNPPQKDDRIFTSHTLTLYVDKRSYLYLAGTEIDYSRGLQGEGFNIRNPNAKSTCGCGKSFQ